MPDPAFHDVRFPTDISRGTTGGPTYRTTIMPTPGGFEQRHIEWDESLLRWNVVCRIWSMERLEALLAFFHARMGQGYAFRFKDWTDFLVGMDLGAGGVPVYNPAKAHAIGVGDGTARVFQLVKNYPSGPVTRVRRITRPVVGSVRVFVDGTLQSSGVTVDHDAGRVTFASAPASGAVVKWAGQFDVPARFEIDAMNLNMTMIQNGSWPAIPIVGVRE